MTAEQIICLVAGIVAFALAALPAYFFTGGDRDEVQRKTAVKTGVIMILIIAGTGAAASALLFTLWWFLHSAGLAIAAVLSAALTLGCCAGLSARVIAEAVRLKKGGEDKNER